MSYSSILAAIYLCLADVAECWRYLGDSPGHILGLGQKAGPGHRCRLALDWNPDSIASLTHSFVRSFTHSFIHSSTHSSTHSFNKYLLRAFSERCAGCRTNHEIPG